jgi:predicted nucleic acid-binding protein
VIVVDSSVWVSHFANIASDEVQKLRSIRNGKLVVVGDLILLEILRGARTERDATYIRHELQLFGVVPMLDGHLASIAARNYRKLRDLGVTVRKTTDLVIGTFCIESGYRLLHRDRDFAHMERHLGLLSY